MPHVEDKLLCSTHADASPLQLKVDGLRLRTAHGREEETGCGCTGRTGRGSGDVLDLERARLWRWMGESDIEDTIIAL